MRKIISFLVNFSLISMLVLVTGVLPLSASPLPGSCQDILDDNPNATDGEYTIFPSNQVFKVYCDNMGGTPQEYLTLINTGGDFNFGQYTAGGFSYGTNVRTSYTKVRLDPATLIVDINDDAFATSTGSVSHNSGSTVSMMPYGTAADCRVAPSSSGIANIDLTGTSFAVNDSFTIAGWSPAGSVNGDYHSAVHANPIPAIPVTNEQVVGLTGGGECGGTSVTGGSLNLQFIGQFVIELAIDINPRHCPNILKVKNKGKDDDGSGSSDDGSSGGKKGNLKVAILGTQDFDVRTIDVATLCINGVTPVKSKIKDVTAPSALEPCDCEKLPKDTYEDLELKFNRQDIIATLGTIQDGDIIALTLTGNLLGGSTFAGKDCIVIKIKGKKGGSSDDDSSSGHKK